MPPQGEGPVDSGVCVWRGGTPCTPCHPRGRDQWTRGGGGGWTSATVCLPLSGSLIYLLNLFCNSTVPSVREETAALFGKMITDKLVGPRVRIILSKFLPIIFMDAMKDSPETSLHMFDSEWGGGRGGTVHGCHGNALSCCISRHSGKPRADLER